MPNHLRRLTIGAVALCALVGATTVGQAQAPAAGDRRSGGAVFAMTNETEDNEIVAYRRATDGTLTRAGSTSTRGNGIGVDLDTQGALQLSDDNRFLYAANAGSDDITVFAVNGTNLTFVQKVFAGDQPNSLTLSGDLLYALDGSVAGNGIRGFRVAADGTLEELPDSFRLLSSPIAVPGIVQFSPDGRFLLVTHKVTNALVPPNRIIDVFRVGADGLANAAMPNKSFGLRPFSLAFRDKGRDDDKLVVVEAFNAAPGRSAVSSYDLSSDGSLRAIDGSVRNGETDGCWIVVSKDGRYAYTANFGSGTISLYRIRNNGEIDLIDGKAAFLGEDSQPVDLSLSEDGRFLYLLLRGAGAVAAFRIRNDGSLQSLGTVEGGLPVADGASGLASY